MRDPIRLLLLKHRLRCLEKKLKDIKQEIEETKENIIIEQNLLLKEKQNESK